MTCHCRYAASVGLAGEAFCGYAHNLSHLARRGGACLGYDGAQGFGEVIVAELARQVSLDNLGFGDFAVAQFGAVLLVVDLSGLAALLGHLGQYFNGLLVREVAVASLGRSGFEKFFLDTAEGFEAHFVAGEHGLLYLG